MANSTNAPRRLSSLLAPAPPPRSCTEFSAKERRDIELVLERVASKMPGEAALLRSVLYGRRNSS